MPSALAARVKRYREWERAIACFGRHTGQKIVRERFALGPVVITSGAQGIDYLALPLRDPSRGDESNLPNILCCQRARTEQGSADPLLLRTEPV